jgi:transposase
MLGRELFVEIKALHQQGKSIREISRLLGVSRNTVRLRIPAKMTVDSGRT